MEVREAVRELANWPESGHLVVSLYLDTAFSDESRRETARIFVKDALREVERESRGAHAGALADDLDWVRDYTDSVLFKKRDAQYNGIAVFICGAQNLRTIFRSRIPFTNAIHVAPRPRIRALAHLYDEYETAVFASIAPTEAEIHLISAGEVTNSLRIETEEEDRYRARGWSRSRYDRKNEDRTGKHLREVAHQMTRVVYRHELRNIVLSGSERLIGSFRRLLPRPVDDSIILLKNLGRNPSRNEFVPATVDALVAAERERERMVVGLVLEMRGRQDRVVVGLDPVLTALEHGRVHRLLISNRFDRPGFRCQACGKLGENPPESCELCGEPVISTDLAEAMVVAAIQRGGEVDEIVGRDDFEELGGVAALLRY
jgi:peptide subunit release factor 1 (eRF1)